MLAVQLCCARHCELPLSKMGNKGLFPGVAVPLAFFCTLFFRHRKKSVSAPWDGKSQSAPESARQAPPGQGFAPAGALVAFRSPPVPFGSPPEAIERSIGLQALSPRRSRRVIPHRGNFLRQSCRLSMQAGGFPLAPCTPSGRTRRKKHGVNIPTECAEAFPGPTHLRGPHCREYRLRFAQTTGPCPLPPSHCLFPFPERRPPYVHSL